MKILEKFSKFKGFIWRWRLSVISWILLGIGMAIGLLLTAQWRTQPTRASDPVASYISLEETYNNLVTEKEKFREKIKNLQEKIEIEQEGLKKYKTSKETVEKIENYEESIGLTDLSGEGIIITMNDAPKLADSTLDSIAHAADLRDIVNLLWSAEAKAISINEERIVFTTSIDCIVNTVLINTTKTTPPFIIKAIGNPDKLASAINNKNELKDLYKRVKNQGLIFAENTNEKITISKYKGSFDIKYAQIVE